MRRTSPDATVKGVGASAMAAMRAADTAGLSASAGARPSRLIRRPVAASCSAAMTTADALLICANSAMRAWALCAAAATT